MKVLFVCHGNLGRSQALREFTTRAVQERNSLRGKIKIDSAGTDSEGIARDLTNPDRRSLTPALVEAYRRGFGVDPQRPNRKPVNRELVAGSDLVLVAEPGIKRKLEEQFPEHGCKIHTIRGYLFGRWIGERRQIIDDPAEPKTRRYIGKSREVKQYRMLKECKGIALRLARKWELEHRNR